jgi:hypothetical protein
MILQARSQHTGKALELLRQTVPGYTAEDILAEISQGYFREPPS